METVVWILHVLIAITVIVLVLLQQGKGADMGAAFGTGSAGGLFGSSGSANFLSRSTAVAATLFFVSSLSLTYFGSSASEPQGVMGRAVATQQTEAEPKPEAPVSKTDIIPK